MLNANICKYFYLNTLLVAWGLSICVCAQDAPGYNFRGIVSTINEFDSSFPIRGDWTGQTDLQIVTQSDYVDENVNPYKHLQRVHIRPWLQYNGLKNIQLAFSTSYKRKFNIPATGTGESDEVRFHFMGTFTQPKSFGSIYEQFRFEFRNVRNSDGAWSHFPRFRLRFGQNYNLRKTEKAPRITAYQEIMFKIKKHEKAYDIARFYIGYGFNPGARLAFSAGFFAQAAIKSNGRDIDVFFGPSVALKYTFGKPKGPLHPPDPEID